MSAWKEGDDGDAYQVSVNPVAEQLTSGSSLLSNGPIGEQASQQKILSSSRAIFKLSILMPVYNEERTLSRAVQEVLQTKYPCEIELIIVNDGSTDNTSALLSEVNDPRVIIYSHPKNMGKGAALRSAIALASGSYALPFDADLEYSSEDVPRMLIPVLTGRCHVVYGARLSGFYTAYQSYRYALGNRFLTRMANILFDAHLSDLHTCLKLIPMVMWKGFELNEAGFGLDTEITAYLLKRGIRPFEIPVSYYGRSHAEGKKIHWHDALVCLWLLLKIRTAKLPRAATMDLESANQRDGAAINAPSKQPKISGDDASIAFIVTG
jgi:dolichol-phosphate hexosyltransferase